MENAYRPSDLVFNGDRVTRFGFYSKVFLYFGLGILLTAGTTILMSVIFNSIWPMYTLDGKEIVQNATSAMTYYVLTTVSSILLIALSLIITFTSLRGRGSIKIPYILYSICMGIMLSTISFYISNMYIIGLALFVTAVLFLSMCAIGYITHQKINIFARVAIALLICVGILCLINFVILPFALFGGNYELANAYMWIYWIVEIGLLALFLIYTVIDMARIRRVAENGGGDENLALFFAMNLYLDFINIFIYVLRFLIVSVANKDN